MKNIIDYLNYYKDYTFEEINFNQIDALVFSILAYLPIKKINNGNRLKDIILEEVHTRNKYYIPYRDLEVMDLIKNSIRYKDIKLYNYERIDDDNIQFGVLTFRWKNNAFTDNVFIAFEGTDDSMIGWKENLLLACDYPSKTHIKAVDYLNKTLKITDKNIYLGGHSKGGNIAMASSMLCNLKLFKKIKKIYNFDGPGFKKKEFKSLRFKQMSKKLINVMPEGSLIGILLHNDNNNVNYIKTNGILFENHLPFNWHVYGSFFEKSELSNRSANIQNTINSNLDELKEEDIRIFVNELIDFINKSNIKSINGVLKINFTDFINNVTSVDKKTAKKMINMMKMIFLPKRK